MRPVKFGKDVILNVDYSYDAIITNILSGLENDYISEQDIELIFHWIRKEFPPDTDPEIEGVHHVSPREEIGRFRGRLLGILGEWSRFLRRKEKGLYG